MIHSCIQAGAQLGLPKLYGYDLSHVRGVLAAVFTLLFRYYRYIKDRTYCSTCLVACRATSKNARLRCVIWLAFFDRCNCRWDLAALLPGFSHLRQLRGGHKSRTLAVCIIYEFLVCIQVIPAARDEGAEDDNHWVFALRALIEFFTSMSYHCVPLNFFSSLIYRS